MVVFNFSHPLSPKAVAQLNEQLQQPEIITVKVQLDLSAPIKRQVYDICRTAEAQRGKPDYIILPGLAIAAVYIDRYFSQPEDDYPPCVTYTKHIRLVMENGTTPPIFVVAEIDK